MILSGRRESDDNATVRYIRERNGHNKGDIVEDRVDWLIEMLVERYPQTKPAFDK